MNSKTNSKDLDQVEIDALAEKIKLIAEDPRNKIFQEALLLMASALRYHKRETRAKWWPHFERCEAELFELADDPEVIVVDSCVATTWGLSGKQKNLRRTLTINASNCNPSDIFEDKTSVYLIYKSSPPDETVRSTESSWYTDGTVTIGEDGTFCIVETSKSTTPHTDFPVAIIPGAAISAENIEKLIFLLAGEVIERFEAGLLPFENSAWSDVLLRSTPRQISGELPHGNDAVNDVATALENSDNSYIAVQGPPGSGKTFLGVNVIAELVKLGWKIGVVAQSHKTVENLLKDLTHFDIQVGKTNKSGDSNSYPWSVKDIYKFMESQSAGFVVGGTAWTFAAKFREFGPKLDLMVIDEAGQFSLAHTVSTGSVAKRILLLGDPQQLAQVSQATHEAPIDNSALSHLLGEQATISDNFGYFLDKTHRMHPEITRVISRLQYEGRLGSHPKTSMRRLDGIDPGVHLVEVEHEGCTTSSSEEALKVRQLIEDLIGRTWHFFDDEERSAQKPLEEKNILVVAAYNAQVRLIKRLLVEAGLPNIEVGTVDKFQGADQPVVIASLAASSFDALPRGLEFLISPNRINVALSRAKWASYLIFSKELRGASPVNVSTLLNFGSFLGVLEESQIKWTTRLHDQGLGII